MNSHYVSNKIQNFCHDLLHTFLISFAASLLLILSTTATMTFLQVREHSWPAATSGHVHLLCPWPRHSTPSIFYLCFSLWVPSFNKAYPTTPSKIAPPTTISVITLTFPEYLFLVGIMLYICFVNCLSLWKYKLQDELQSTQINYKAINELLTCIH